MADRKWQNPVRSQMNSGKAPSVTAPGKTTGHNPCPAFSKPQDTGNGGIPVVFQDNPPGMGYGKKVAPDKTGGLSAPSAQGPTRPVSRATPPSNKK